MIIYNNSILSYASALLLNNNYPSLKVYSCDFLGNANNIIKQHIYDSESNKGIYLVGFPPNKDKINLELICKTLGKRVFFIYPYSISEQLTDNVYIIGKHSDKEVKNVLEVTESLLKGKAVFESGASISRLYHALEVGNITKYSDSYDLLLKLLDNGVESFTEKDSNTLVVKPNKGNIKGVDIDNFKRMLINLSNSDKVLLVNQDTNYMAYRFKALSLGATSLVSMNFGLKGNSIAKFVVFPNAKKDTQKLLLNYLKSVGFEKPKITNNIGYMQLPFNWESIINARKVDKN